MYYAVECKHCKGKGYHWDWVGMCMTTIALPLIYLIEKNDPDSPIKEKCEYCNGKGYIKL